VALSASAFAHEQEGVLAAGLDDFLRKPFRREEVFDCMARHLGVHYLYRQGPSCSAEAIPARPPDFAMLSEELRKELLDAVLNLDSERVQNVIGRVQEQDPQAGEFLAHAAKQLAYSKILEALHDTPANRRVSV
jgi:CheY-like chemotaxis protein